METHLSLPSITKLATPSLTWSRLNDVDKRRFAGRRPHEALVHDALSKTGSEVDAKTIRTLDTLNRVLLNVLSPKDALEVMGSSVDTPLCVSRLDRDMWHIARAPKLFEVVVDIDGGNRIVVDRSHLDDSVPTAASATRSTTPAGADADVDVDVVDACADAAADAAGVEFRVYGNAVVRFRVFNGTADGDVTLQFFTDSLPASVNAYVVSAARTAAFARFLIPSIDVYCDSLRDSITYATSTFHAAQRMCGFAITTPDAFLTAAASDRGVVTPDYVGSDFHTAFQHLFATFLRCDSVAMMDSLRKLFRPRDGTTYINGALMAMVRMHDSGGGCAGASCPARDAAVAASALRQRVSFFASTAVSTSETGLSYVVSGLIRSFLQYMLLSSSVHVNADALFLRDDPRTRVFREYVARVKAVRASLTPVSLSALPSIPSHVVDRDALGNAIDAVVRATRITSPCSAFSNAETATLQNPLCHIYDAATTCAAADCIQESLLSRLESVPGLGRVKGTYAVVHAVSVLDKRHKSLQRVVLGLYDTLGTSSASPSVPEISQLTRLCCSIANVCAAMEKIATTLAVLARHVRDVAFGALRRDLLAFAHIADRMHYAKKRAAICERMTILNGMTFCASNVTKPHSSHAYDDAKRIVCTDRHCTDAYATHRYVASAVCFSCNGTSFELPSDDSWVYSCRCCKTFLGTSDDFECGVDIDDDDGRFVDVPLVSDASQWSSTPLTRPARLRFTNVGDDCVAGFSIDAVFAQHVSRCSRKSLGLTGYVTQRSAFITCTTCALPLFVPPSSSQRCLNPKCERPTGVPNAEQFVFNDVSGDVTCLTCGVVCSEHAVSTAPFKVNYEGDVDAGRNNVQNGPPIDRRASLQLTTSFVLPCDSKVSHASFSALLTMHQHSNRFLSSISTDSRSTSSYLRDTHKVAFFKRIDDYVSTGTVGVDSAEWAKDVFFEIRETDQLFHSNRVQASLIMMAVLKTTEKRREWACIADAVAYTCPHCCVGITAQHVRSHGKHCTASGAVAARAAARVLDHDNTVRARKRAKTHQLAVLSA